MSISKTKFSEGRQKLKPLLGSIKQQSKLGYILWIVAVFLVILTVCILPKAHALSGINQTINFQGRLLTSEGAVVPDGYYNIEFKIYNNGDGQSVGDTTPTGSPGTLLWTEDYLNNNSQGVVVRNGFLSVNLGSITPFGSSVNWNSDTLWLSMNIGSTSTTCTPFSSCTPDGEMVPMKQMTASPYALNSNMLNGLTASNFLQLAQGLQTDSSTNSSIAVNKTGASGDLIQLQASGTNAFVITNSGDINFGSNANHQITIASASSGAGNSLTISGGSASSGSATSGGNLILQGGAGDGTASSGSVIVQSNTNNSSTAFAVQNASSSPLFSVNTSGNITQVGSATANTNQSLFVLNNYSSATDPTNGTNGAMYYNTSLNTFRCYTNGSWGNCSGAQGSFVQLAPSSAQTDSSTNSSIFINKTGASGNLLELQASGVDAFVINNSGNLAFGNASHSISVATAGSGVVGNALTVSAGTAGSGGSALVGGNLVLQGGAGGGTNSNGGNVSITGGVASGTGVNGLVLLSTPTFSTTTNDPNCYTGGALVASSCTIASSSLNNTSAIVVGFSQTGQTATLPSPGITTAGRIVYIIAANGSSDFVLSVNGGGVGNQIAMRQNTSATMVWSGSFWTAAGASSSTTLQAAYNNTMQSAGGAELIVSHTANTNGLTIRDSSIDPVNGPLLSVQTNSAATLLSINSNVTEYSSDSGGEVPGSSANTFPANTWGAVGTATVSRYTTVGSFIATGQGSVQVVTPATASTGVKNTLATALTANQNYNLSFAGRLSSGSFTTMQIYYSVDGTTQSIPCTTSQTIVTSVWTKVNCSFTAPASGITSSNAILIVQSDATARTFYIDNMSVTIAANFNYATDGGVDNQANFTTNWPAVSSATVSRNTVFGQAGGDSAQVVTTGANQGISNLLSVAPLTSQLYRVTTYVATSTTGFNSFTVNYTPNGGTTLIPCVDYNTQAVQNSTSQFTQITCYIQTNTTAVTTPYVYFTQTDATGRTFYVDSFSFTLASATTPNVQIGGGQNGGPTTLFTLDSSASAPIASNNVSLLGSMYYDTTLGKIQCYEASGWGSCGSASNSIVTISPEYTNAVLHGSGVGTMTSDICSGTLGINNGSNGQPTICGPNATYNFYRWTSPQATPQTYSIYVTYQLPTTFNQFLPASTSLMGETDSANSTVQYTIFLESSGGLTQCGSTVAVSTGAVSSWQTATASGAADPASCGFAPGNSVVFKIDVIASQNANAYVSNLNFTFSNK